MAGYCGRAATFAGVVAGDAGLDAEQGLGLVFALV